ncbi:transketolase [Candidatus Azambacteria bacterium RIFCSPHIGHO2_01_FULL_40_24]|uniref:Transketolase n=1 Tax=Candidatus Azambacteria bacterium RIFCSPHIGHO2_01_FULL_40_24 TaxID=1797301 RepID=A0A1F5B2W5_9BACT|nr:MAG: transketolase [Candidatus Azambacteria bacterium RIFCSPHIGHO2_01_FULL_40_24]
MNKEVFLIEDLLKAEKIPTRDGYGKGLVDLGEKDERVVVLCADLAESTRSHWFKEKFPERYIELGVAEQNMATVAAGLANYGKIPFISSYAVFSPGRNNEQIRTTISLNNLPVKICGAHAGISVGPDGATHQALEDIALMRIQPRMTVIVPCDAIEARKATNASVLCCDGPVYLRFGREKSPVFTTLKTPFEIGKAIVLRNPSINSGQVADVTIVGCGMLLYNVLIAAEELSKEGIEATVINSHTIKPLDIATILNSIKETKAVVTVEEHQVAGGLGSAVAEALSQHFPAPQEFIGVHDRFGESGEPDELIEAFGMGIKNIKAAVLRVIKRKS